MALQFGVIVIAFAFKIFSTRPNSLPTPEVIQFYARCVSCTVHAGVFSHCRRNDTTGKDFWEQHVPCSSPQSPYLPANAWWSWVVCLHAGGSWRCISCPASASSRRQRRDAADVCVYAHVYFVWGFIILFPWRIFSKNDFGYLYFYEHGLITQSLSSRLCKHYIHNHKWNSSMTLYMESSKIYLN